LNRVAFHLLAALVCTCSVHVPNALSQETSTAKAEYVVLIHGLGRTSLSMARVGYALRASGYKVLDFGYPSTCVTIERSAELLARTLEPKILDQLTRVAFITHSMGALVLREYLSLQQFSPVDRIVMIAPPNHGSEIADRLSRFFFYRLFTGPAGQQLRTANQQSHSEAEPIPFETGVIAGDRSLNPLFSRWIGGRNDGKVSVTSTKLNGMKDFKIVHHSHSWIMWRKDTIQAALRFLTQGSFGEPQAHDECLINIRSVR